MMTGKGRDEEEQPEFTVTDRRMFTAEGELRQDAPEARRAAEAPPPKPPESAPPPQFAEEPGGHGAPSFEQLVMSLATSAMLQLGLAAAPGDAPRLDLPAAKDTIDLMEILQAKTKGNLTLQEDELLTGTLYELRMAFVELTRRVTKGPSGPPGPPRPPGPQRSR